MEDGETKETLARELNEELGIHAEVGEYFCSSFFEHRGERQEMRAYLVTSFTGMMELPEHQEIRQEKIKDLANYDMPEPDKLNLASTDTDPNNTMVYPVFYSTKNLMSTYPILYYQ